MTLAFPASPSVGQVFQQWQWSGVSWDPVPRAPATAIGNRVLLASNVATAALANVVFTGFDNTYDVYEIEWYDVRPNAAPTSGTYLCLEMSTNAGTSWLTATNQYDFFCGVGYGGLAGAGNAGVTMLYGPNVMVQLNDVVYGAGAQYGSCHGRLIFPKPWLSGTLKHAYWNGVFPTNPLNGTVTRVFGALQLITTLTPITGVRIRFYVGNMAVGASFKLYGIAK